MYFFLIGNQGSHKTKEAHRLAKSIRTHLQKTVTIIDGAPFKPLESYPKADVYIICMQKRYDVPAWISNLIVESPDAFFIEP